MTNLRDVARRAGVSVGSVSAVIDGRETASHGMRQRVIDAITELDYSVDGVARSLRLGRTRTIGLLVSDITDPHFSGLARAIERECEGRGYALLLANSDECMETESRRLLLMRQQRVDGLILALAGSGRRYSQRINSSVATPAVILDRARGGDSRYL